MELPCVEHRSSLSIETALATLMDGSVELAASVCFSDEYDEDEGPTLQEVHLAYEKFFLHSAAQISAMIGEPVFSGRLAAALDWATLLEIYPSFEQLSVWRKGSRQIYLTIEWEDRDTPIIVRLGSVLNPQIEPVAR